MIRSLLAFGHPIQVDTSSSQVICICVNLFTPLAVNLRADRVNPFGQITQGRTQVLVLQTCVDLRAVWQGLKTRDRHQGNLILRQREGSGLQTNMTKSKYPGAVLHTGMSPAKRGSLSGTNPLLALPLQML